MADIYRVAVASTDGESVNQHFGRADTFLIFSVDDETGYDILEKRRLEPVCLNHSHNVNDMQKRAENLRDCKYVTASKIGPGAESALRSAGIISMELPGDIDEAILKIWKYNRIQKLYGKI